MIGDSLDLEYDPASWSPFAELERNADFEPDDFFDGAGDEFSFEGDALSQYEPDLDGFQRFDGTLDARDDEGGDDDGRDEFAPFVLTDLDEVFFQNDDRD